MSIVVSLRHAEFARACVQRSLQREAPLVRYFGVLREDQKDVVSAIRSDLFQHWDSLPDSPPKVRPRPETAPINTSGLHLLSCDASGTPCWPDSLLDKFVVGTSEHIALLKLKESFLAEFPPPSNSGPNRQAPGNQVRVSGTCDFAIDDGKQPIDVTRLVDLCKETMPEPASRS